MYEPHHCEFPCCCSSTLFHYKVDTAFRHHTSHDEAYSFGRLWKLVFGVACSLSGGSAWCHCSRRGTPVFLGEGVGEGLMKETLQIQSGEDEIFISLK